MHPLQTKQDRTCTEAGSDLSTFNVSSCREETGARTMNMLASKPAPVMSLLQTAVYRHNAS